MTIPRQIRDTVRHFAHEHGLLQPGRLVVAVSGGTDSVALLLLLADLAPDLGIVLQVAYFDHRVRRSGAADARFVSDLAASVGAPVRLGRADQVPASEDAAREARYAFLRRAAAESGAAAIATGHTRDDQAETVLLHLVRGSGIAGLAGMRPRREDIVRPLLCIGREETTAVCHAAGITPREDPSNRSLRYARNRVRRRVLPELRAINPQASSAIVRLADAAAELAASQAELAQRSLDGATRDGSIDLDALGADPALREEALALAWLRSTGRVLSARGRSAVASQAARADGRASLDLPGGRLVRDHRTVRITSQGERSRGV
jgi:tRNA(Ile)-lysidine synthase